MGQKGWFVLAGKVLYFFDPTLDPLLTTPFGNGNITLGRFSMALTAFCAAVSADF